MGESILNKNKQGYGYCYTELAEIHRYLEENNLRYYQFVKRIESDDYIFTQRLKKDKDSGEYVEWGEPLQGLKIVDAVLNGIKNPAQEQGSATTYARRYSLLMAFGLATEDDDGASLTKTEKTEKDEITTKEQAENYKLNFGKHSGKTIKEIVETEKDYANWLYNNGDDTVKKCLNFMLDK